jgi:hypothetical protein
VRLSEAPATGSWSCSRSCSRWSGPRRSEAAWCELDPSSLEPGRAAG